jgi:hypothetical protein
LAFICRTAPGAIKVPLGFTDIELSVAVESTVTCADLLAEEPAALNAAMMFAMFEAPAGFAVVTTPLLLPLVPTVAADRLSLLHVAEIVRSCDEPSLNCPVAERLWRHPAGTLSELGVITIEEIVALVTVREVEPVIVVLGIIALTVTGGVLAATVCPVARLPDMEATLVFEDVQFTRVVKLCVLPSVKVPMAVN